MAVQAIRWAVLVFDFDFEPVEGHEQGGRRRGLVVSYEPLHAGGLMAACPVTASRSSPRYPGEIPIPAGEAGQTKPGLILCHQVRTVSILRAQAMLSGGSALHHVTDPDIRAGVRDALATFLGLDIPGLSDGAMRDAHFGGEYARQPADSSH